MPRTATVPTSIIVEKLNKIEIFDSNKNLKLRSDLIWTEACSLFDDKIKIDNLYLRLKQDRNGILTRIKQGRGMSITDSSQNETVDSLECTIESIHSENNAISCKGANACADLFFELTIDPATWEKIGTRSVVYKEKGRSSNRRRYTVLKPGWTDVLSKICRDKCKLPCAYSFKRAKVYEEGIGMYLRIAGKCKECGSLFNGYCLQKPSPGKGIKISVKTSDTREVPHFKKRHLKGILREDVQKQLMHTKAAAWRCAATSDMEYGDCEPPHLYNLDVLRKARQEGKDKVLGLYKAHDPIASLQDLKCSVEFSASVREIALDKFYCMYWSPMQLDLYKEIVSTQMPLSIDATGSVVQRLNRPTNRQSGAIFLYQGVMQGKSGIIPMFQMLSEKHDTNTISYWLNEWLRCGVPIPKETITDFSLALFNAVSLAFNECSLKCYMQCCMQSMSNKNGANSPRCIIRIDIAHTIKMITRWKCFVGKLPRIKDFYLRCIGVMTTCKSAEEFNNMLLAMLIVASCEATKIGTECEIRETFLLNTIETFSINELGPEFEAIELDGSYEVFDDQSKVETSNFDTILKHVEHVVKKTRYLERPNPYCIPDFVTPFLRFCQYFPLWTNIMSNIRKSKYETPTSARSETYFNNFRNNTLSDEGKPLRMDKFIVRYVRSIEGVCKIERAARNFDSNVRPDIKDSYDPKISSAAISTNGDETVAETLCTPAKSVMDALLDNNKDEKSRSISKSGPDSYSEILTKHLNEEENWKGMNKKPKAVQNVCKRDEAVPKRGKYLRPCPDVTILHNRPLRKRKDCNILNGSMLPGILLRNKKIRLSYTCPFDSIVELTASACSDYDEYNAIINFNEQHLIFFRIVTEYVTHGLSNNRYTERALFLKTIFDRQGSTIACHTNISTLLEKIFKEFPSAVDKIECSSCKCKNVSNIPILEINSRPILQHGLTLGLQESIDECFSSSKVSCKSCNSSVSVSREPGMHVLIDTEHAFMTKLSAQIGYADTPEDVSLANVPNNIVINSVKYNLMGLIHFVPPPTPKDIGHYIAFCKRLIGTWEQHDSLHNKAVYLSGTSVENTCVNPAIIGYVWTKK